MIKVDPVTGAHVVEIDFSGAKRPLRQPMVYEGTEWFVLVGPAWIFSNPNREAIDAEIRELITDYGYRAEEMRVYRFVIAEPCEHPSDNYRKPVLWSGAYGMEEWCGRCGAIRSRSDGGEWEPWSMPGYHQSAGPFRIEEVPAK